MAKTYSRRVSWSVKTIGRVWSSATVPKRCLCHAPPFELEQVDLVAAGVRRPVGEFDVLTAANTRPGAALHRLEVDVVVGHERSGSAAVWSRSIGVRARVAWEAKYIACAFWLLHITPIRLRRTPPTAEMSSGTRFVRVRPGQDVRRLPRVGGRAARMGDMTRHCRA